jgi:hypothetical protein
MFWCLFPFSFKRNLLLKGICLKEARGWLYYLVQFTVKCRLTSKIRLIRAYRTSKCFSVHGSLVRIQFPGVNLDPWYESGSLMWAWPPGMNLDMWYEYGLEWSGYLVQNRWPGKLCCRNRWMNEWMNTARLQFYWIMFCRRCFLKRHV